jgi:hypothetical protein
VTRIHEKFGIDVKCQLVREPGSPRFSTLKDWMQANPQQNTAHRLVLAQKRERKYRQCQEYTERIWLQP